MTLGSQINNILYKEMHHKSYWLHELIAHTKHQNSMLLVETQILHFKVMCPIFINVASPSCLNLAIFNRLDGV